MPARPRGVLADLPGRSKGARPASPTRTRSSRIAVTAGGETSQRRTVDRYTSAGTDLALYLWVDSMLRSPPVASLSSLYESWRSPPNDDIRSDRGTEERTDCQDESGDARHPRSGADEVGEGHPSATFGKQARNLRAIQRSYEEGQQTEYNTPSPCARQESNAYTEQPDRQYDVAETRVP